MHIIEPSSHYLGAAQQIAIRLGLDIGMVANGHPIDYKGLNFWLRHDEADPGVMVVMVEIGDLPVVDEVQACRELLQQHYFGCPAIQGCYCLLPGTDVIACCARFDIESSDDVCADALRFIDQMAAQKDAASHLDYQGENQLSTHGGYSIHPTYKEFT